MAKKFTLRNEILKSLYALSILFVLDFVLGQGYDFRKEISIGYLKIFLPLLFVGMLCFLISPLIRRAIFFRVIVGTIGIIFSIILSFSMYVYLVYQYTNVIPITNIILNVCLLMITVIISTQSQRDNLLAAAKDNVKSGRLDLIHGLWDTTKELHWDNPQKEQEGRKVLDRAKRWSIVLPGLGAIVARWLDPSQIELSQTIVLWSSYFIAVSSGRQLNLIFQLKRWEDEIGKPILIKEHD